MATQQPPQLNAVPPGFDWKQEAAEKAAKAGRFLYVGGDKISKRALSGAPRYWNSEDPDEQSIIYNVALRITGTPDNVARTLRFQGRSEADIQAFIADSINKDNVNSVKRAVYDAEVAYAKQAAEKKPVKESPYKLKDLIWFAEHLDKAKVISTKAAGATAAPAATAAGGKRRAKSLADRVAGLAAGKMIDVSDMDYTTGDSAVTRVPPAKPRNGKYWTNRVPFMSNNLRNYQRAIELAYGPQGLQTYAKDIERMAEALNPRGQATAVVVAAPVVPGATLAPPVVPGATLAPPPTINGFPVIQ